MAADRWENVFALFDAALARPEAERGAFLSRECGDDTRLRQEVQSLLEAHGGAEGFLSGGPRRAGEADVDPSGPASPMLKHGMRLGIFEVESFLGAGGIGEVWQARENSVALTRRDADRTGQPLSPISAQRRIGPTE